MAYSAGEVLIKLRKALNAEGLELGNEEEKLLKELSSSTEATGQVAASIFASRLTERALRDHANALRAAAAGSKKYAARLSYATWALVVATFVLATLSLVS